MRNSTFRRRPTVVEYIVQSNISRNTIDSHAFGRGKIN